MIKYLILLNLLYLSNALGFRIEREVGNEPANRPALDDTDRAIIRESGCKYLSLATNETVLFTKDTGKFQHTTLAALAADNSSANLQQTNFELHFAVRSAGELQVPLYSRYRYYKPLLPGSDYKIVFGAKGNQKAYFTLYSHNDEYAATKTNYVEKGIDNLLSPDRYQKLYIKLNGEELMYGIPCDRQPKYRTDQLGFFPVEFVQFGFTAVSDDGAKILYDCPATFAGCPCDWKIY